MSANQVTITGSMVTGPVAGGDVTIHGLHGPTSDRPGGEARESEWGATPGIKAGLALDIVGYSRRGRVVQDLLLAQLDELGDRLRRIVGPDSLLQSTGDGFNLLYTADGVWLRTAEPVLGEIGRWVADIGGELTPPLRVRVVLGIGQGHQLADGISGNFVVELTRVLNSPELRAVGDPLDGPGVLYAILTGAGAEQIAGSRTASRSTVPPRAAECAGRRTFVGVL